MQTIDGVEYLDVDEAAGLLGVKKATLYAYVSRGMLQSFRQSVGRKRLYRREDVEALRVVRPSDERAHNESIHGDDDSVLRDVTLPDAASWAGEH
jgi:excisionase family DNA binding protein